VQPANELTPDHIDSALAGNKSILRRIVDILTPVIQVRVARTLLRRSAQRSPNQARQAVADMVQDVFVALFDNDGRVLRSWDPTRGSSLCNFIGLAAERHVLSRLRSAKRNPWTEELLDPTDDELSDDAAVPEVAVASRELLTHLAQRLKEELTPLGLHVFRSLFIENLTVEDLCLLTHMTPAAVYAWRSRINRRLRLLAREFSSEEPLSQRIPYRGGT
jgi:RNA polymerase sigma factor (sigma-70 family)